MERTVAGNFARTTQALADKAAPVVRKASGRAQSTVQQGLGAINDIAGQAREAAVNAADSIVSYYKEKSGDCIGDRGRLRCRAVRCDSDASILT